MQTPFKTPSNKIGILLVVVVLVVAGIITFSIRANHQTDDNEKELVVGVDIKNKNTGDADGDGLADWQEILRRTDPANPDTDGDGTPDGMEIELGRDPNNAGENDVLTSIFVPKPGTLTDDLSLNFASDLITLEDNNYSDEEIQNTLIQNYLSDLSIQTQVEFKYSVSNLKTFSGTSDTAKMKAYGNKFAEAQLKFYQELINLNSAQATDNFVLNVSTAYKNFAINLGKIETPSEVAESHVNLMNNFFNAGHLIEVINNANQDPTKAVVAVKEFQTLEDSQPTFYFEISDYFKNNGIIFDENEVGNFWNNFE